MKEQYSIIIRQLDEFLTLLYIEYAEARLDRKAQWLSKINNALDKRLDLMRLRNES